MKNLGTICGILALLVGSSGCTLLKNPNEALEKFDPSNHESPASDDDVEDEESPSESSLQLDSLQITPGSVSFPFNTDRQLTAMGTYEDESVQDLTGKVLWFSSNASVATVSNTSGSKGLVLGVTPGTAQITATSGTKIALVSVTVTNATLVYISVNPPTPTLAEDTTLDLVATGLFSDGTTAPMTESVSWSSSNPPVAVVSDSEGSKGRVTSLTGGSTTVSATHSGVTGTSEITVSSATLVSLEVSPLLPMVAVGTDLNFYAVGTFSDGSTQDLTDQVNWSSGDEAVATISGSGLATSLAAGTSTMGAEMGGITGSTDLTVTSATLESLAVSPLNPTLSIGETQSFVAMGTYSDGSTANLTSLVLWSSSHGSVANIQSGGMQAGLATALGAGTSTIQALMDGRTGSTTLTVSAATLESIEINPVTPTLAIGGTVNFTAIGVYSDGTNRDITTDVAWGSSDGVVASVSNAAGTEGLATALAAGTSTIGASLDGVSEGMVLTVSAPTLVSVAVTPANPSLVPGLTESMTAVGTYSDTSTQDITDLATWSSATPGVADVSNLPGQEGLVTAVASGTAVVSATLDGVSGQTTVTVSTPTLTDIVLSPTSATIIVGYTEAFSATGHFSDGSTQDLTSVATWSTTDPAVCDASNAPGTEGVATALSPGTVTLSVDYGGITRNATVTVAALTLVSIQVTPVNATLNVGDKQNYTAVGTYNDSSTQDITMDVTWKSTDRGVIRISNKNSKKGEATARKAGTASIQAVLDGITGSTGVTVQ